MTLARLTVCVSVFIDSTKCRLKLLTKGFGDWSVSKCSSLQGQRPEVDSQTPYKHTGFDGVYLYFQNWEGRGRRGFLNRQSNLLDNIKANEKTLY